MKRAWGDRTVVLDSEERMLTSGVLRVSRDWVWSRGFEGGFIFAKGLFISVSPAKGGKSAGNRLLLWPVKTLQS